MRIAYFCFVVAALAALTGMSLGIFMGINQDFSLAPAHAHLNLLGWVTMCLYGLYHRGVARARNRLAWTQVSVAALGFPLMTGGLAHHLATGTDAAEPFISIGSLAVFAGMLLFIAVLVVDLVATGLLRGQGRPAANLAVGSPLAG